MHATFRQALIVAAVLTVLSPAALAPTAHADPAPTDAPPTTVAPIEVPSPLTPMPPYKWLHRPSGQNMADYYPLAAMQQGVSGHVSMSCKVVPDGHLTACAAVAVTPPGQNFDYASLKLARYFQLDVTPKGDPTLIGTTITIQIGWLVPR